MKKTIFYFSLATIFFSIIFIVTTFPSSNGEEETEFIDKQEDQSSDNSEKSDVIFGLVTDFTTLEENVSSEKLEELQIYVSSEYYDLFSELDNIQTVEEGVQINELLSQEGNYMLMPINELTPKYKLLKVDNIYPLKDNLDDYPLIRSVETQEDNNFISQDEITDMFAGGEIITARGVDIMWLQRSNNNLEFLFDRIRGDIESADIAVSMFEHSYFGDPDPCPRCTSFVGDEELVPQIADVGFDVISLAGNHIGDLVGAEGMIRTEELLDQEGIKYMGAGEDIEEASSPTFVNVNDTSFSFLGADEIATFYWAGPESRGTNHYTFINTDGNVAIDYDKIEKDISEAKSESDVVIVYMSWGIEYTNEANDIQREIAQAMIDSGADLILGTHPHWVQNIEFYKDVPIIYSMGNLIFDQTHTIETSQGMYLNLYYHGDKLLNMQINPLEMCGYHKGAKNVAEKVLNGELTYDEVDELDKSKECIWLQPERLSIEDDSYDDILKRIFEFTTIEYGQ